MHQYCTQCILKWDYTKEGETTKLKELILLAKSFPVSCVVLNKRFNSARHPAKTTAVTLMKYKKTVGKKVKESSQV